MFPLGNAHFQKQGIYASESKLFDFLFLHRRLLWRLVRHSQVDVLSRRLWFQSHLNDLVEPDLVQGGPHPLQPLLIPRLLGFPPV